MTDIVETKSYNRALLRPGLDEQQRLERRAEPGVCDVLDLRLKPKKKIPLHRAQQA